MTWKAHSVIFHDPNGKEYQPGDVVPDAVVKASPWLAEEGLVSNGKAQPVVADEPAPDAASPLAVSDDPEAPTVEDEG